MLIHDNISIKEELIMGVDTDVNLYDKSKFENNAIHKSKNRTDWIFIDNENKNKQK